jgi:hypothetical protein
LSSPFFKIAAAMHFEKQSFRPVGWSDMSSFKGSHAALDFRRR